MNDINYQVKFANFQAITDNHDPDIAMKFLQEANWDENEASNNYLKNQNINFNSNSNRSVNSPIEKNFYKENLIDSNKFDNVNKINEGNYNPIEKNRPILIDNNQRQSRQGGIMNSIKSLFCCGETRENEENTMLLSIFENLPGRIDKLNEFVLKLTEKIGIVFIYREKDRSFDNFIEKLKSLDHIIDILRENFIFYSSILNSEENMRINFQLGIKTDELVVPTIIFLSHKLSKRINLTRDSVIEQLVGYITTEIFYENLIKCVEEVQFKKENQNYNNNFKNIFENSRAPIKNNQREQQKSINKIGSNAAIIQEQNEELNNLLKEEEAKKKKKLEEERRIQKEKEDNIRLEQEKEEIRKKKIINLPEEPAENHKESSKIVFRFPDGNRRSERRFLRSDKIGILYDYVDSLGKILIESDKYDLIQTLPRKVFDDKNKTLEEEGLYPNGVLQIREI